MNEVPQKGTRKSGLVADENLILFTLLALITTTCALLASAYGAAALTIALGGSHDQIVLFFEFKNTTVGEMGQQVGIFTILLLATYPAWRAALKQNR